ncbi:molybdenum ABC transporter ATP-binding protein [Aliikangiella sp. IMCC44653]
MGQSVSTATVQSSGLRLNFEVKRESFQLSLKTEITHSGITALFGPSGSGKTTILRAIAGLEPSVKGEVIFNDEVWLNAKVNCPVEQRRVALVFQDSALLPHLNVKKNLKYAIKRADLNNPVIDFKSALELFNLESLLNQFPSQLSGGEQQRVAIASALLTNPRLIIMDEPLASLDNKIKCEIIPYLKKLKKNIQVPIIYVSHSIDEVAQLADQILFIENGQLIKQGDAVDLFSQAQLPNSFNLDRVSIIKAKVDKIDTKWNLIKVSFSKQHLWLKQSMEHKVGDAIKVIVHSQDVSISLNKPENTSVLNCLPAEIIEMTYAQQTGMENIRLAIGSTKILATISAKSRHELKLERHKKVWVQFKAAALIE